MSEDIEAVGVQDSVLIPESVEGTKITISVKSPTGVPVAVYDKTVPVGKKFSASISIMGQLTDKE